MRIVNSVSFPKPIAVAPAVEKGLADLSSNGSGEQVWVDERDQVGDWYENVDSQNQSLLFGKLPAEIRNIIWEYCFDENLVVHFFAVAVREYGHRGQRVNHGDEKDFHSIGRRCPDFDKNKSLIEHCHCILHRTEKLDQALCDMEKRVRAQSILATRVIPIWDRLHLSATKDKKGLEAMMKKEELANGLRLKRMMEQAQRHEFRKFHCSPRPNTRSGPAILCKRSYNETMPYLVASTTPFFTEDARISQLDRFIQTSQTRAALRSLKVSYSSALPLPYRELQLKYNDAWKRVRWEAMWTTLASLKRLKQLVVHLVTNIPLHEIDTMTVLASKKALLNSSFFAPMTQLAHLDKESFVLVVPIPLGANRSTWQIPPWV